MKKKGGCPCCPASSKKFFLPSAHGEGHDGFCRMEPVLSLVVDGGVRAVDDRILHLVHPVGGEGVHVQGMFVGEGHALLRAFPVLVCLKGAVDDGLALVGHPVAPVLGDDHIGIPVGLFLVVGDPEGSAVVKGVLLCLLDDPVGHLVALRVGQGDFHAVSWKQEGLGERDGDGFLVGGGIGPDDGDLESPGILSPFLLDGHEVGDALQGVIQVVLHADDGHGRPRGHLPEIGVAFLPEAVPARDGVAHAGQDDGRVLGHLAVGDLHVAGIEKMGVAAELGYSGLHGIPRTRRLLEEHEEHGLVGQIVRRPVEGELHLQVAGNVEKGVDFFLRPLLEGDEMFPPEKRLHDSLSSLNARSSGRVFLYRRTGPPHRERRPSPVRPSMSVRRGRGPGPRVPGRSRRRECRTVP
ncbi:hypothetical protein SDC9_49749 [bioreactor metagenome]|uniref:Uncharacterized protein n=1 Tax=bioreactor metagenome TaxID=1076179 RepID=A0A644WI89_9ZZZZ